MVPNINHLQSLFYPIMKHPQAQEMRMWTSLGDHASAYRTRKPSYFHVCTNTTRSPSRWGEN